MKLDVIKNTNAIDKDSVKIKNANIIYELEQVQEIKNAFQEHVLLIGMNVKNKVININCLGIGRSNQVDIDVKDLIRTAILNGTQKVVLVHNHPSGELTVSESDKYFTNKMKKILEFFEIELLDHVIVSQQGYISLMAEGVICEKYTDEKAEYIENIILLEENQKLQKENQILKNKNKIEVELEM